MLRPRYEICLFPRCASKESSTLDEGPAMISIFDYGAGNLRSVENTLGAIGAPYKLVRTPEELRVSKKLILPGVGHFGQMMRALGQMNVRLALLDTIRSGVPFLGICLGLQALFTDSEEAPAEKGLGLFPGTVRRFQGDMRIPHMGWNQLELRRESKLLRNTGHRPYLYFAHSYYAPLVDATSAVCEYSLPYTAVLEHNNVSGVQFHPEKSGDLGLRIVRNFVES